MSGTKPMARIDPQPGEVWFADLGMIQKCRPILVLAAPRDEDARALVVVEPLTSQIRGTRGEVYFRTPSLSSEKVSGQRSRTCQP